MKLVYHEGRNFGDALNPLVFRALFPDLFDEDERVLFIGIGSVIGLKHGGPSTERRIYFSSGFAAGDPRTYGTLPRLGPLDDVVCVRGPLTAEALGLPPARAIADGAILYPHLFAVRPKPRPGTVAYVPHAGSFAFFQGWRELLAEAGIELIDPREPPQDVIAHIAGVELLIAEAMHGAILADAIGIPWIPVAAYGTINAFKWSDFTASMGLTYAPVHLPSLHDRDFIGPVIRARLGRLGLAALHGPATDLHGWLMGAPARRRLLRGLMALKKDTGLLSDRGLLAQRVDALLERAEYVRRTYGRR
ncbi:MAG: polysaccharide pyruvyl transferase family protein [Flavobacteriales bacterium]|nr:polysaccharide pyruvyl transferase family protein [Flavobacteriales bacterium]